MLVIFDYNKKVFVVRGCEGIEKPRKNDMKLMGGRWTTTLKCGPSWVFLNSERYIVEMYMKQGYYNDIYSLHKKCEEPSRLSLLNCALIGVIIFSEFIQHYT
jgi:hypothetical protein